MDKKNNITQIYKSIDKALNKLTVANAKDYLKYHKSKPWYTIALKGYKNITKEILGLLKEYSKKYGKVIEGKEIFKKKIKKDDEDDHNGDDEIEITELGGIKEDEYEEITEDDIKEIIEEITEELLEELEEFYDNQIKGNIIINAAEVVANNIGLKFNFNKYNKLTREHLEDKKIEWANQVAETTKKRIKETLVKGFEEGLGSYDIAELIYNDNVFSYNRAEAIARTEVIGACNYADNTMWQFDDNIIGKKWSATGDERTRLNHAYADGQIVPKDKPFIIGGYKLMHPGDSSLGAPAEEVINCRCTMLPVLEGESLKSNTIYDDKDVGTVEWLKRQDEDFQLQYLKNNKKLELFKHDKLKTKDLLKNIHEIAVNIF